MCPLHRVADLLVIRRSQLPRATAGCHFLISRIATQSLSSTRVRQVHVYRLLLQLIPLLLLGFFRMVVLVFRP